MSTFPCGSCGHPISTAALSCPQCGAPGPAFFEARKERDRIAKPLIVVGGVVAGAGMLGWCSAGRVEGAFAVAAGLALFVVGRIVSGHGG